MLTLRSEKGSPLTHEEMDANFKNLLLIMSALYVATPSELKEIADYINSEQEPISLPFNLQVYPSTTYSQILAIEKLKLGTSSINCNATNLTDGEWDNKYVAHVDKNGILVFESIKGVTLSLEPQVQYFFVLSGGLRNNRDVPPQINYVLTGTTYQEPVS